MLWTVFWTVLVSVVTLGLGLLASPPGRRKLKRLRSKAGQHRRRRSRAAWSHYRKTYRSSRRRTRRATRRTQPPRLTFGHVRTKDDPHPVRVLSTKVRDRVALARSQARDRKAAERSQRRTAGQRLRVLVSQGPGTAVKSEARHAVSRGMKHTCNATTKDGTGCHNLALIGDDGRPTEACYIRSHQDQVAKRAESERTEAKGRRVGTHGIQDMLAARQRKGA